MLSFDNNKYLLLAIANCGLMTDHIAKKHFSTNNNEVENLISNNLIERTGVYLIYGKSTCIYTLTDATKEMFNQLGKSLYKSDTTQLEHDYILLKVYSTIDKRSQESWQNESELKSIYRKNTCDGVFKFNDKLIGVEIITKSYTKIAINEKMSFINQFCDDFISLNTSDIKI